MAALTAVLLVVLLGAPASVPAVAAAGAPLYLVNSTDELVPLSQARAMAERLADAGVAHQLDVLPGTRHALDFREDAWAPTVAFLDRHLATGGGTGAGSGGGGVAVAAVAAAATLALAAAGYLALRRCRRRRPVSR